MLEITAVIGVASAGALWRIAFTQGSMKRGMEAILHEVQLLRNELGKDIVILKEDVKDHEMRLRQLENSSRSRR
ncbi:MAG: hypothetical protein CMB76_06925 [Euryarchaeota archaeon]|nr:hypothetical protein [Euryarchaeota archaeon]